MCYGFVRTQNPYVLDVAMWRAAAPGRSFIQQRAAFLLEQVRLAQIEIRPLWRLAGYSQIFKLVDRELQNHIIARTKHQR